MFFYERWDNEAEETKFYEKYWENKKLGKGVTLSGSRGIKVFACILGGGGVTYQEDSICITVECKHEVKSNNKEQTLVKQRPFFVDVTDLM